MLAVIQSVADTLRRLSGRETIPVKEEIESFLRAWQEERGADCPLPALYRHLKTRAHDLTVGAFHDILRSLHASGQLRLTGWGGTLDEMPEPELTLFVSNKVMYYAHLASRSE